VIRTYAIDISLTGDKGDFKALKGRVTISWDI